MVNTSFWHYMFWVHGTRGIAEGQSALSGCKSRVSHTLAGGGHEAGILVQGPCDLRVRLRVALMTVPRHET